MVSTNSHEVAERGLRQPLAPLEQHRAKVESSRGLGRIQAKGGFQVRYCLGLALPGGEQDSKLGLSVCEVGMRPHKVFAGVDGVARSGQFLEQLHQAEPGQAIRRQEVEAAAGDGAVGHADLGAVAAGGHLDPERLPVVDVGGRNDAPAPAARPGGFGGPFEGPPS